jgi:hypothetical protein
LREEWDMPTTLEMQEVTVTRVPGPVVAGIYDDCVDPFDGGKDAQHGIEYPDDQNWTDC